MRGKRGFGSDNGGGVRMAVVGLLGMVAVGCSATPAPWPVASPAVAFGASATDVDRGCWLEGPPRVLALHVKPAPGITAVAVDGLVWVRFATTRQPVAAAVDPDTLQVVEAEEPPMTTAQGTVSGLLEVGSPDVSRPVAWTLGSVEDSRMPAIRVSGRGAALAAGIDLGFHGSAFGRPAIAFDTRGRGVLAFIESNQVGFEVVVVRAVCVGDERVSGS